MTIPTILRAAEHAALKTLNLSGSILDLGGDGRSEYRTLIQGDHTYTTVNLDEKASPDVLHDLEQPLPLADASYDHVLLINVLEHVFEYRKLLREAARVVRPGGSVAIVVPFLFPVHPSPSDFWRFTLQALERECVHAGLVVDKAHSLGTGVFASRYILLDRLMPGFARALGSVVLVPVIRMLDAVFSRIARVLGKKYASSDYALGYFLLARAHNRKSM